MKVFSKFQNPALIIELPVALRVLKTAHACTSGAGVNTFFFLQMVSEQVNLIHVTPGYGKI